jgi:hypothetical protein
VDPVTELSSSRPEVEGPAVSLAARNRCDGTVVDPVTELSSRPERSEVEGPAVSLAAISLSPSSKNPIWISCFFDVTATARSHPALNSMSTALGPFVSRAHRYTLHLSITASSASISRPEAHRILAISAAV